MVWQKRELSAVTFQVVVDYGQSLAAMISAGNYDGVDINITEVHFPVSGQGVREVEVLLFHFGRAMISEQVLPEMDEEDYQAVRIEELLGLGARYPGFQWEFPIIGLGSVWQDPAGSRRVPCLNAGGMMRYLRLPYFSRAWDSSVRFAAVCK